jgi:hypothetical protein
MNRPATTRALFLASMVFASAAAFAGNDINKCVQPSGQLTLTDEVCPSGAQTIKVINGQSDSDEGAAAEPGARSSGIEHYTLPRMPARHAAAPRATPPARGLSLDVATLKAARANMQSFDTASQSLRSQRLAGLQ